MKNGVNVSLIRASNVQVKLTRNCQGKCRVIRLELDNKLWCGKLAVQLLLKREMPTLLWS